MCLPYLIIEPVRRKRPSPPLRRLSVAVPARPHAFVPVQHTNGRPRTPPRSSMPPEHSERVSMAINAQVHEQALQLRDLERRLREQQQKQQPPQPLAVPPPPPAPQVQPQQQPVAQGQSSGEKGGQGNWDNCNNKGRPTVYCRRRRSSASEVSMRSLNDLRRNVEALWVKFGGLERDGQRERERERERREVENEVRRKILEKEKERKTWDMERERDARMWEMGERDRRLWEMAREERGLDKGRDRQVFEDMERDRIQRDKIWRDFRPERRDWMRV